MKTCLIVDDVAFNRKKAKLTVEQAGYKAEEAERATDIGKFVDSKEYKGKIDYILLDWHMPEISGATFLGLIKGSKYAQIPIFLYSAEENEALVKNMVKKVGAKGYLPKNFTAQMLKKTLEGSGREAARKTCLVVDDIDFNRTKAAKILESMGFRVEQAKDVPEVSMYFEAHGDTNIHSMDVVLMDWHLPALDGPKIIQLIRRVRKDCPIFLYTAVGDDKEGKSLAEKVGADGFIPKQLSKGKLEAAFKTKNLL